jgi:hypothetical protein
MRKGRYRVPLTVAIAIALLFAAALIELAVVRAKAERFVAAIRDLRLGASANDVRRITAEYNGFSDDGCTDRACRYGFRIEARLAAHLGLVPRSILVGGLLVEESHLTYKIVSFQSETGVIATLQEANVYQGLEIGGKESGARLISKIVRIGATATPSERAAAYDFTLTCVSRFGGCTNANDILPVQEDAVR